MAAVWNPSQGKQSRSAEKMDRELRRLRFDVKQYDAQLKKLQRELILKNSELKKLKSCGACTCLGDRRRSRSQQQIAEVRDLGTFGTTAPREIGDKVRLEIHGQRPASVGGTKSVQSSDALSSSFRRSKTEFFLDGVDRGVPQVILAEKDKEFAKLHEELAQLKVESSALKTRTQKGDSSRRKEDENVRILRELGKQVQELENELLKLREERYRLLSESEKLHGEVNSKETNLLRCESQLTKAEREKHELASMVRRLEQKERQLTNELNEYKRTTITKSTDKSDHRGGIQRWNSDLALPDSASANTESDLSRKPTMRSVSKDDTVEPVNSISKSRDCNPYCEVCRVYRSKLVKHNDKKLGALSNGDGLAGQTFISPTRKQPYLEPTKSKQTFTSSGIVTGGLRDHARQRELEMVVEEAEKQKSLLQRYLNEIQAYERSAASKDKEITNLKMTIRELEGNQKCLRRKLSDHEATIFQLQRDLAASTAITQKTDQSRTSLSEEHKRLEQDYRKLTQDKTALQRELELCIDEQDKQNRLVQRYENEIKTYEQLLADKDREISKLKSTIRDLEKDYDEFRKNLAEQEANLLRLQRDLSSANAAKDKTEQGRVVLVDDYKRLQQQYQTLHQDKSAIQRELELCIEEQEKQKRMLQRYLGDIQSYERLLAEKEKERMEMLLQFQASADRICKCGNNHSAT